MTEPDMMNASKGQGIIRAFIAIEINDKTKFIDTLDALKKTGAQMKIVRPENLHITLKFLGNIHETAIPDIVTTIKQSTANIKSFKIKFHGLGVFPNMNRISVIWAGIHNAQSLSIIAENIDSDLGKLGIEKENREFSPHLTLARMKSPAHIDFVQRIIKENLNTDYGELVVDTILLKQSVLTPNGPIYTMIESVKFE